jgi:ribosomal-protein-alanine N-acetyltransferase
VKQLRWSGVPSPTGRARPSREPPPRRGRLESIQVDGVEDVHRVARESFAVPWEREVFEEELERDWARLVGVRDLEGRLVAFVSFWLVRDEIHVLSLATSPASRRHGHARALMEHVLEVADERGVSFVSLEVREDNRAAIALYRDLGFEQIGVRPGYYSEEGLDARVMILRI